MAQDKSIRNMNREGSPRQRKATLSDKRMTFTGLRAKVPLVTFLARATGYEEGNEPHTHDDY